jgi:hypothetical protein
MHTLKQLKPTSTGVREEASVKDRGDEANCSCERTKITNDLQ